MWWRGTRPCTACSGLLDSQEHRWIEMHLGRQVVNWAGLAELIVDISHGETEHLLAQRCALWELLKRSVRLGIELAGHNTDLEREWFDAHTDSAPLRAERDTAVRQCEVREREILELIDQRDRAMARVRELEDELSGAGEAR